MDNTNSNEYDDNSTPYDPNNIFNSEHFAPTFAGRSFSIEVLTPEDMLDRDSPNPHHISKFSGVPERISVEDAVHLLYKIGDLTESKYGIIYDTVRHRACP